MNRGWKTPVTLAIALLAAGCGPGGERRRDEAVAKTAVVERPPDDQRELKPVSLPDLAKADPSVRERIFNWNFADWREDAAPVYEPYFLSARESWECFLEKVATAHSAIDGVSAPTGPAAASRPAATLPDSAALGVRS